MSTNKKKNKKIKPKTVSTQEVVSEVEAKRIEAIWKTMPITTAMATADTNVPTCDYVYRFIPPSGKVHTPPTIVRHFFERPILSLSDEFKRLNVPLTHEIKEEIAVLMAARQYVLREAKGFAILWAPSEMDENGFLIYLLYEHMVCTECKQNFRLSDLVQCKDCGARIACQDCLAKKKRHLIHPQKICDDELAIRKVAIEPFMKGGYRRCMWSKCNQEISSSTKKGDIRLCSKCTVNMYCCEDHQLKDRGSDMEPGPHHYECLGHQKRISEFNNRHHHPHQ
jgi:hypothetical protein